MVSALAAAKDKILWALLFGAASAAGSFGWWSTNRLHELTIQIHDRPDVSRVIEMVTTHAPYIQDRKLILEAISRSSITEQRLVEAINRNTEAINELKVEIAKTK